jgi:peptidoglycan/LPS O-acetylase OafA/YrhL
MGLVRLFLACVVAIGHWRVIMLRPLSIDLDDKWIFGFNAGYAVMFFYMISGFLITYTLGRNYSNNLAGAGRFYANRFIRIFSLYWPLVGLAFLTIDFAWHNFVAASIWDKLTGIFLLGMDWRLAFASYPQQHWAAAIDSLHPAWTLGAELTFYLAAPLLMRSWKIGAALLLASFGLRAAFVCSSGVDLQEPWTYQFLGTTFGFFMLGHLVCLASHRWRILLQPAIGAASLVCSFAIMTYGGSYAGFDTLRFWGAVLGFTIALPAVFEGTKNIRWINWVGNLSYPVYLIHTAVVILLGPRLVGFALPLHALPKSEAGWLSTVAFLSVTTLAAAMTHRLVEVPVAAMLRGLARRPQSPARGAA